MCWCSSLYLGAFSYVLSSNKEEVVFGRGLQAWRELFFYFSLVGIVLPMSLQTIFVSRLIKKASKLGWLETDRLTQYSTITVILLSFTGELSCIIHLGVGSH